MNSRVLHVTGATFPDLLESLVPQLLAVWIDPAEVGQTLREKLSVQGSTFSELLRAWVEALLKSYEVDGLAFVYAERGRLEKSSLGWTWVCDVRGEPIRAAAFPVQAVRRWTCDSVTLRSEPPCEARIELSGGK